MPNKKIFNNWVLLVLLVSAIAFWQAVFTPQSDQTCVWFLDVGQGDAIYIRTRDQHDVLIDGGPNDKVLAELGKVMPYMDKGIDLVIATHADKDHIGGLDEVLESYAVQEIWWNGEEKSSKTFKDFWRAAGDEVVSSVGSALPETRVIIPAEGQSKIFGADKFQLIYTKQKGNSNERSLVTMLTVSVGSPSMDSSKNEPSRTIDFLFTGDLPAELERNLPVADIEVLKVGHHGSKTSTSGRFLDDFKPEYAVISAGKDNSYGHPHQIVLDRLQERHIKTLRTDEQGNAGFCIDQEKNLILSNR